MLKCQGGCAMSLKHTTFTGGHNCPYVTKVANKSHFSNSKKRMRNIKKKIKEILEKGGEQ